MGIRQRDFSRSYPADVVWSEALTAGVPARAMGRRPGEISTAAQRVAAARHAVAVRLSKIPECDFDAADDAAVTSAYDDVRVAREEWDAAIVRRDWLLTAGNSSGGGLFVLAVVSLVRGTDPMSPAIAALLGGATVAVVVGLISALVVTRRARSVLSTASSIWYDAMAAARVTTMGELHARRLRHHGCARATMELEAAQSVATQAEGEWRRLVGPSWEPEDVATLLRHLSVLRNHTLSLLGVSLASLADLLATPDAEVIELRVGGAHRESRAAQAG